MLWLTAFSRRPTRLLSNRYLVQNRHVAVGYVGRWTPSGHGALVLRVWRGADSVNLAGASRSLTVTVR